MRDRMGKDTEASDQRIETEAQRLTVETVSFTNPLTPDLSQSSSLHFSTPYLHTPFFTVRTLTPKILIYLLICSIPLQCHYTK